MVLGTLTLWEMAIGVPPADGYRLHCDMTEDRDAEEVTVRVIENGAELESQTFEDTPDNWQAPHKYAGELHAKYFGRAMDRMRPFYLRRFNQ
jgi:hypothetical protein